MCPWRDLALIVHQGRIYDRYAKSTRTIGCLQAPTANRSGTCCRALLGPVSKQQREFGGLPQSPSCDRRRARLPTTALISRRLGIGRLQGRRTEDAERPHRRDRFAANALVTTGPPDDRVARIASRGPCPLDLSRLGSTIGRFRAVAEAAGSGRSGGLDHQRTPRRTR
jgi:hypothetical protein